MLAYLVLFGYADFRPPANPARYKQLRALAGLICLVVKVGSLAVLVKPVPLRCERVNVARQPGQTRAHTTDSRHSLVVGVAVGAWPLSLTLLLSEVLDLIEALRIGSMIGRQLLLPHR